LRAVPIYLSGAVASDVQCGVFEGLGECRSVTIARHTTRVTIVELVLVALVFLVVLVLVESKY
jgi:hypothetical protein